MGPAPQKKSLRQAFLSDWSMLSYIILLTIVFGYSGNSLITHKYSLPATSGYPMHIPVMLATDRGFTEPEAMDTTSVEVPSAPELGRFLRNEISRIRPEDIPKELRTTEPSYNWVYYHRYMYHTVGLLWRVFGISWSVVVALRIALLCVMMVAAYGLLRLAANRFWSLAGTAILFPGFFIHCFDLRDFSKGAFVLASMFVMGFLLTHPVRTSRFLTLAGLLGLVAGVGIGFRADVLACVPAGLFVLAFCARPDLPAPRLRRLLRAGLERLAAMGLLAALFLLLGWPILQAYYADRITAHDFGKGLATVYDDTAGVGGASYERMYRNDDDIVSAAYETHSARIRPSMEPSPDNNARRQDFARCMVQTFPGDMVTRAYVSVLWVLRGGMLLWSPKVPVDFWKGLALLYAAAFLLLVARRDLRLALMLFALLMYFCGYLSFQADRRHGFHLGFIPVLIAAVLFERLARTIRGVVAASGGAQGVQAFPRGGPGTLSVGSPRRRMAVFAGAALLLLLVPLYAARAVQHRTFGPLLERHKAVELDPVATEPSPMGDWTLFQRRSQDRPHSGILDPPGLLWTGEYWVAEFSGSAVPRPVYLHYVSQGGGADFSQGVWVRPVSVGDTGTMRYFFPVYELRDMRKRGWSLFSGIAVPKDEVQDFKGLYRVRNDERFTLFLNLSLPADPSSFVGHQVVFGQSRPVPEDPEQEGDWFSKDPDLQFPGPDGVAQWPNPDKAIDRFEAALKADEGDPVLRLGLAAALDAKGDAANALEQYRRALLANPTFYVTYHYIDGFFNRTRDLDGRVSQWRDTARDCPENWLAQFHLAMALEDKQDREGALEAYRRAVALNPGDAQIWSNIARLLSALDDIEGAEEACRQVLRIEPHNVRVMTCVAALNSRRGDYAAARNLLRAAIRLDPEQYTPHEELLDVLCLSGDYEAAWEEVAACRRLGLSVHQTALDRLERLSGRRPD